MRRSAVEFYIILMYPLIQQNSEVLVATRSQIYRVRSRCEFVLEVKRKIVIAETKKEDERRMANGRWLEP